jgi:type III secretory pathway component EscT
VPAAVDPVALAQQLFLDEGISLEHLGLTWARFLPTVLLVPAFGLQALPVPARVAMGLSMALAALPAMGTSIPTLPTVHHWPSALLVEVIRGFPVALACAIPLWTATMAGGTIDALRGHQSPQVFAVLEGKSSSLGILFSLLASLAFLASDGPAHVSEALLSPSLAPGMFARVAFHLQTGIKLAIAIASPLLAISLVFETGMALVMRTAGSSTAMRAVPPMIRQIGLWMIVALFLERITTLMVRWTSSAPGLH